MAKPIGLARTIVGRERELAAVVQFLDLMSAEACALVIDGEAGIGKLRWCTERRRVVVEFWLALANAAIVCSACSRRAWTCYRWQSRPPRRP